MPKIAFRAESDPKTGAWRLQRCLALASGLKESDPSCEITFLSHARDAQAIARCGFAHAQLGDLTLTSWDLDATAEKVGELGADMLVVDRPAADEGFLSSLAGKVKTLAAFGDSVRLKSYAAHALIDPSIHAHLAEYPCDGALFLGTEFALLPPEFDEFQEFRCANPEKARRLLVYFSGQDHALDAVRLLKSLPGQFSATVLSDGEELAREIGLDPRFNSMRNEGNLARRLAACDFAITGPESLCEPALFALPTALIGESPASDYAAKNGLALSLGAAGGLDPQGAMSLEALLSDKQARDRMSARLSELVDGMGRFRLAEELLELHRGK
ncbi:MAG: hypothetical protein PHV13_00160 [Candidatus ainarchaeum sp.]|nr:hypothetical protein [Candidatus ainarchaeum sp.]